MENKIRILFISQYFPPEMGAPSARVYELSRRWVQAGAEVTVLTSFPNHPTGEIPESYRGYLFLKEKKDGIRIIRTYIYAAPNKGFFRRILTYLSFMFSSILQGTRMVGKQDIIIATSPQFFVAISGYIISRIKKTPFIFELRDFWPESIVQLGILKNKFIIRFLEWIEMFLYRHAIHIVGVVDSFKHILVSRGIPANKVTIIKNGVDLNLFINTHDNFNLKKQLNLHNKFIVSYIGTHGLAHALDKVIEAGKLLEKEKNIFFLFIGEGAEKENLKRKVHILGLKNIKFIDKINKNILPEYYQITDISLVPLRKISLFKNALPSKLFEIMAMEKPILLSIDGEARKFIEKAKAGLFAKPEDPQDLADKILYLYNNKKLCLELGGNGRQYVERYFNRDMLADKYLALIQSLLSNK